jgi:hypothetical protein
MRFFGLRACYEEGKRVAETMMYAYQAQGNVQVRVRPQRGEALTAPRAESRQSRVFLSGLSGWQ